MTYFEIAKIFAKYTGTELAERLGVSPQHLNAWIKGSRVPNRNNVEYIASVLGVDPAWLLGLPQTMPVVDPLSGDVFTGRIMRSEAIDGYGELYHVYLNETGDIVPVILSAGIQFTPTDWTTLTVRSAEEIAEARWMDARGQDTIMLDGLPRVIA